MSPSAPQPRHTPLPEPHQHTAYSRFHDVGTVACARLADLGLFNALAFTVANSVIHKTAGQKLVEKPVCFPTCKSFAIRDLNLAILCKAGGEDTRVHYATCRRAYAQRS